MNPSADNVGDEYTQSASLDALPSFGDRQIPQVDESGEFRRKSLA